MIGTYHPQSSDELKKKLAKGYACTQKELDRLWKEVDEIEDQEDLRLRPTQENN